MRWAFAAASIMATEAVVAAIEASAQPKSPPKEQVANVGTISAGDAVIGEEDR